jgi:hypothetical protein
MDSNPFVLLLQIAFSSLSFPQISTISKIAIMRFIC